MLPWQTAKSRTWQWGNDGSRRIIAYTSSSPLSRITLFVSVLLVSVLLVALRFSYNIPIAFISVFSTTPAAAKPNPCAGRYIYIHRLPSRFNTDMLANCSSLNKYVPMCNYIVNGGFGFPLNNISDGSREGGWYWTNQFTLELIIHERVKDYDCLTSNSSMASAVFVPYYAGLDVSRYLWDVQNFTLRDSGPRALVDWVRSTPEWKTMGGRDHFFVAGRCGGDFIRQSEEPGLDWGNNLMIQPESRNMTLLTIEASGAPNSSDFAVPYPTGFHPSDTEAVHRWQNFLRQLHRPYLFGFAGAPRSHLPIRDELISQCNTSSVCGLLLCGYNSPSCDLPWVPMRLFQQSAFCLQPPGDTPTRRSTFDSILTGCIPVFFDRASAYDQYKWHFPADEESYSVFIEIEGVKSGNVSVEETLKRFREEEVTAMRETVLGLIPKIVYADPTAASRKGFEDAFDIAIKGVLNRIQGFREEQMNLQNNSAVPPM